MVWQDRDYNRGGGGFDDYFSNPAALLNLSVPFGTWFGVRVRLHFWLLLTFTFVLALLFRGFPILCVLAVIVLMLLALFVHDFAHRAAAKILGGRHDEFMFWPAGGMIFPQLPPGPGPMFVGHVAGIAANALLAIAGKLVLQYWAHLNLPLPLNPLQAFGLTSPIVPSSLDSGREFLLFAIAEFSWLNWGMLLINVLPYYWFDGGFLAQSILWPMMGAYHAINLTCWGGMILAVPMFAISLTNQDIFALIFWALLFFSAYSKRKELGANGTGEMESAIAYSASQTDTRRGPAKRRWMQPNFDKVRQREKRDQQKIDAILEKVHLHGMHSLTWWEKRTLRKATERQRQREGK